jgi:putative ABC transport system substrate-binding protein
MQFNHLRRRKFIVALGSAAAWPRAGRAQQGERVRRVSVIMGFAEADPVWQAYLATFRQRLHEFGWTEGRNVRFDYRFTGESAARMRSAAAEVVALAPDVIFVSTKIPLFRLCSRRRAQFPLCSRGSRIRLAAAT